MEYIQIIVLLAMIIHMIQLPYLAKLIMEFVIAPYIGLMTD